MKTTPNRKLLLTFIFCLSNLCFAQNKRVIIVNTNNSAVVMKEAASRLQLYLRKTYPATTFTIADKSVPDTDNIILQVDKRLLNEEYRIYSRNNQWIIAGDTPLAVMYGVNDMLEQLGWQFYLSYEIEPSSPHAWDMTQFETRNKPIADKRIIFNWHNFLSGCTGWDIKQWKQWIEQASKMKFNTIMVHAYANNPMNPFSYNGQSKPLGYLSTTKSGRDWGTQHVNDVRLLFGGELFDSPVFGAQAAQVPEKQKSEAAVKLMQQVFRYAARLGMDVCFAIDTDTWMANPQNIIQTLPADALLDIGKYKVANPEHPEGYKYYRAQIETLLANYPEITHVAFWSRRPSVKPNRDSIWLSITPDFMPASWKNQYDEIMSKHPKIEKNSMTSGVFALSKIAAAIEKSIRQIKPEMELSYGSWGLNYTVLGDIFFPPAYGMIPLDYSTVLNDKNNLSMLAEVGKRRKLYPIVWAHHDDHRYNGRPYIPFSSFNSLLHNMNADGFGIIHWKTHPLDLYFANNARQVWERTENESYYQTICRFSKSLSKEPQKPFDGFLQDWYHHAPMFGRETSDNFLRIDKPYNLDGYSSALEAVEKAKDRVAILEEVNVSRLTKAGKRDFQYHRSYESFLMSFFNDHEHAYQANALLKQDRVEEAREQIKQAHPAQTIQTYAGLIKAHGPTRGELGIVISLNLRWYPDFVDLQQRLRIKPIRISFQPTSHDPLSQGTGHYSYLMDENQKLWLAQGTKELGFEKIISNKKVLKSPRDSYALLSSTLSIPLRTMRNAPLSSGSYRIELLGASKKPPSANVTIRCRDGKRNIFNKTFVPTEWNQQVTLGFDSSLSNQPAILQIDPQGQPLALSGIVLTPVPSDER